jgi:uncharacterized protein (DUF1684 family)
VTTLTLEPRKGDQGLTYFPLDPAYRGRGFLHTPLPADGVVDLDFNRAYNPPSAFTNFATCPLPIKENQLDVRIPAGELRFHLRH